MKFFFSILIKNPFITIKFSSNKKNQMGNEKSKYKQALLQSEGKPKSPPSKERSSKNTVIVKSADLLQNTDTVEMFLFGCDAQNQQKIIAFDSATESFRYINKPPSLVIYNYAQAVLISKELIALTGGTNKDKSIISSQAFLYNKVSNNATVLPIMSQSRFSHISLFYKDKLYVFGGRSKPGDANILYHCEYLQLTNEKIFQKEWTCMPNSILKRCTGFALVYNEDIYLIGGYTGQRKRSKKLERFLEINRTWELINLRLLYGVERGLLLPGNDANEFMIFGGKIRSGDTNLVYTYNMFNQTYSYTKEMLGERVLQKGFESQINKCIYMIGGDTQNTIEKVKRNANNTSWEWTKVPMNLPLKEQIKQFAHAQTSVIVPYSEKSPFYSEMFLPGDKKHFLFGTDCEPFIAVLDVNKNEIRFKPVPNPLRLYGYQGIVPLNQGKYFICGGLFYSRKKISRDAFIYNAFNHTVQKCQKMIGMRYTMNVISKDEKIFVIGGRSYGGDNEGILDTCECFEIAKNEWKVIAPLKKKRCTAMSFVIDNIIYIAGGYNGNVLRETSFESYNEIDNVWNYLGVELSEPLEASLVLSFENKILFLGGRNKIGDTNHCLLYDYTFGIDTMHLEASYQLMNKKCLHKRIMFEKHILLLGGEKFEQGKFSEFVSYENKKSTIEIMIDPKNVPQNLISFSGMVLEKLSKTLKDPKLQKYGFV